MREGLSAQSDNENSAEYYYRSRTTYNGQITGKHTFALDELDWSASYSYANRNVPDRRRYLINDALEPGVMQLTSPNDISREWTKLDEHIVSAAVNDKHEFKFGSFTPSLKFGPTANTAHVSTPPATYLQLERCQQHAARRIPPERPVGDAQRRELLRCRPPVSARGTAHAQQL
mgnify:CR=1 FL=1